MFTLTWQIISDELNSTEFLVTLSLGRAHIRMTSHICEERDSKVIKKIDWVLSTSVSPKLRKLLGSEAVSCWVTASIYWATALLSHYYASPLRAALLYWTTCAWLSELRWLFDTHFLPFLYHFQTPRTKGAINTPSAALFETRQQLLDLRQCSKIKSIMATTRQIWATVPFVQSLRCFFEPPRTLILLSHYSTILSQCTTILRQSRFAEPRALAVPLVINKICPPRHEKPENPGSLRVCV